ncbi:MAG TPA: outer membrane beta-barrel protein [Cyclobacteriaceae bacterium]|nr:outer membrane beta-barrel protein [Cyclobacteriaceae bacterium]HPW61681.1 outer membrane beta-barrel protein [Cyclobacteriaceae bacterium]
MKKYTAQLMQLSLALILLISGKNSFAQDNVVVASAAKPVVKEDKIVTEGDKAAAEAKAEEEDEPTFTFAGSIDTYFHSTFKTQNAYYGDAYAPSTSFADLKGFGIGMVNLIASYGGDKAGFTADVVFGPRGQAAVFGTASGQAIINQAFAYYKFSDKLTLNLGQFNTFLGYEVISPTVNFHYSTSYLFSWGPFNHTGARLDYASESGLVAKLAVMNPTDIVEFNPVNTYTLGAQLGKTSDKGGIWFNFLYGDQDGTLDSENVQYQDASAGKLFQADVTLGYNLTDKFYLGFNASSQSTAVGEEADINGDIIDSSGDPSSFFGLAVYPKLTLSESFALGLRAEYFSVKNGHLGIFGLDTNGDGNVMEFTLSGNYKVGGLTFIPEVRVDKTSEDSFFKGTETKNLLPSLTLAAVYKF